MMGIPIPGKRAFILRLDPEPWFNVKMTSYQYRKSHCGDKTILRPSYLHNGISYTGKTTSLYWIGALVFVFSAYNPHTDPSTNNAFQTGAFRFGHSQIPNDIRLFDKTYTFSKTKSLGEVSPLKTHDDVIKFSALLAICAGIHRSSVNSSHKRQWRVALMFSLISAWINDWVNNREAGNLRRHRARYDVTVMHKGCQWRQSWECQSSHFLCCSYHYSVHI